ncbi:MAG: sulfotransferase [Victivallaceae bacterium]|nr:sulfotransferase [Victivallaceae bacterium]
MKNESLKHNVKYHYYTRVMNWYRNSSVYIPLFNEAVRAAMKLRYHRDQKKVAKYCHGQEAQISAWFEDKKLFFGFSSFRCGTVFLTNLFTTELADAHIEHEANVDDYWNYPIAMQSEADARSYIDNFRLNEIYCRANSNIKLYGEINPFLRLHCKVIKEALPQAKCFHIIRDGRDLVRSIMSREILSKKDPLDKLIIPPPGDPYRAKWPGMSRFEKVCWQWQYDNRYIRENIPHLIHFEQMRSDYSYFKEKVLDFLELEVSEATWSAYVTKPKNITPNYRCAKWTEWDSEQKRGFEEICGEEFCQYGYKLDW